MTTLTIKRKRKLKINRRVTSEYFSIHSHSRFSNNDALPSPQAMVTRAKELGYPGLAITDHGNMAASVQLYQACRKAGIKPFPGSEMYFVIDREDKKAKRYHLCLVAYTTQGYRNLVEISTRSHENFHHKPLIDFEDMAKMKAEGLTQGIALTTGCFFGLTITTLINQGYEAARNIVATYASFFDTYVEIQSHNIDHGEGVLDESEIASALMEIADDLMLPVVITQDSHYVHEDDRKYHESLKGLVSWSDNPDEAVFPGDGFHMVDEMWMKQHHPMHIYQAGIAGLQNLLAKHDMFVPELEEYAYQVPHVTEDPVKYVQDRVAQRLDELGLNKPEYTERLVKEFDILDFTGMYDYMALVAVVCDHMRDVEMFYQVRGSAAGSLVSYLLDISNVDPLVWGLSMERFLAKDRLKPPDIDIDVEHSRRQELIEWCQSQYAVVQICTQGTYSIEGSEEDSKGSLRVKVLSTQRKQTGQADWGDVSLEERHMLHDLASMDLVSNYGVHAAGLVMCTDRAEMRSKVPMMYIASSKTMVSQYNGKDVEGIGLVKLDVLGVKTLTVLRETIEALGRQPKDGLDFIPLDDKATYASLRKANTSGVFQLEGGTASRYIRQLAPTTIKDVIAAMALFRPGVMGSGATDSYLARKKGEEALPKRHPIIANATKSTYGILLYQDLVIDILRALGMESDDLTAFLKAVKASNKNVSGAMKVMEHYEPIVRQMCHDAGMNAADIAWLWDAFEAFANYSFNLSHATVYGITAYRCAYLSTHHPLEFHAALLNIASESSDAKLRTKKIVPYIQSARSRGISIRQPDINLSVIGYGTDGKNIRKGLMTINRVGQKAAAELVAHQPYTSMSDLCERVNHRTITGVKAYQSDGSLDVGIIKVLHESGVLDSLLEKEEEK